MQFRGRLDLRLAIVAEGIELLDGAGEALRAMKELGFKLALVTNRSGVGRGRFPESMVHAQHARLDQLRFFRNRSFTSMAMKALLVTR